MQGNIREQETIATVTHRQFGHPLQATQHPHVPIPAPHNLPVRAADLIHLLPIQEAAVIRPLRDRVAAAVAAAELHPEAEEAAAAADAGKTS